ncbi:pyridoxal-phosphate dependent enzyme [Pseudonocardia sp. GCM10023141]|uniref:pyridoxal-phosphate dependent enzyme n=1 Tax=Pseudonocardia sp. GCM10023141 TaxID=3252653 RepID=UPI003614201D
MTVVGNSHRRPELVPAAATGGVREFHAALPGYAPTPLRQLDENVWLKDESDRFGLPAFKILGASWAVERTVRERPGTRVLVAASAGNHGRAVARVAALRGLASRIYLPAAASAGRARLIAGEGAEVVRVDGDYDAAVAHAEREAGEPGAALVADTAAVPSGGPPEWVIDGYSTLFAEIDEQLAAPVGLVLVPAGVGSFTAAAVRWAVQQHPGAAVIAVEPAMAACVAASLAAGAITTVPTPGTRMAGMDCATPSATAWPTLRHGLTGAVAVTDAEARQVMRELAALGIVAGDCGAATVAALRRLPARQRAGSVVCVSTEGASDPDGYADALAG